MVKDKLNVNDEVVITGKFHVAEDWPRGVPKPDATYLNVSSPTCVCPHRAVSERAGFRQLRA